MNVDLGPLDVEDVEVIRDALIFRCGISETDYERSDVLVKWLTYRLALARLERAVDPVPVGSVPDGHDPIPLVYRRAAGLA